MMMSDVRAACDERSQAGGGNVLNVPAGYKHTELGVIPEDWRVSSLGSLLSEPPAYGLNAPAVPFDGSRPTYIRITDIGNDGRFRPSPRVSVNGGGNPRYLLRSGDLVFARTGASVGKSYLYDPNDGSLVFAGFLIRVTPDAGRLLPAYTAYYVQTDHYWEWVANNSVRSGQPGINSREYGSLLLPLPPLPEQRVIAAVLSDVDELIGSLEALIAKKRAIKQATMQELLTGRKRLPGFKGEWDTVRLGKLLTVRHGRNHGGFSTRQGQYPVLGSGGVMGRTNRILFDAPSVLIGRKGTINKPQFMSGPFWAVDTMFYTEITPGADPKCLFYLFCQIDWLAYNEASGLPSLNAGTIESIVVSVPSLPEQRAIATILSDMDAEIAALERRLDKTRAIKQGMMQQLLAGSIRLPIPDDDTEDDDAHDA